LLNTCIITSWEG